MFIGVLSTLLGTPNLIVAAGESRVVIQSSGWELVGDLRVPESPDPAPAVLMLNKAAGDRQVYKDLAARLAERGVVSLRLDLRGHGESTNLGRFVPGETDDAGREIIIWQSDEDVTAAHRYLKALAAVDSTRIGIVGASYSGEEMAEAGRKSGYARAYVALSPGSFSDESIAAMDTEGVSWLFVVSRHERYLKEIAAAVQSRTRSAEILYLPGDKHATRILEARTDVAERIAVWLAAKLEVP